MRHSEVSSYFTQRALAEMRSDPTYLPSLTLRKLALFWGPAEVSNNKVLEVERENSTILKLSPSFADIFALAILGGVWLLLCPGAGLATEEPGIAEASVARSRTWELAALLLLFLLTYTASYLPFFAAARFRLPLVPILMVFAGAGLARLGSLLRSGRYRPLAWGLIVFALLRAGSGFAWVPYEPNRPLWHFRRALSHQQKGQVQAALEEAHQTLDLAPTYPDASLLLADLLNQAGHLEEAVDAYRKALLADPGAAVARGNLATTLMRLGQPRQAIEQWEEALRQQPDRLTTLNNLALALATLKDPNLRDPERAVGLSEQANRLTHFENPSLRRTLEIAYSAAGREDDARQIRQRASSP
jgi:tetratricopeptide (TPR) repeat protein